MFQHERIAPGGRLFGIADSQIFIAVRIDHQQSAMTIGEENLRHIALGQPFAFKLAADFGALVVDLAATADLAVFAQSPCVFFKLLNHKHLTAQSAGATGTTGNGRHSTLNAIR
jgi:hypothetical protein